MSNKNRSNYNKMYDGAGKRTEVKSIDEVIPTEVKEEVVESIETSVVESAVDTVKMEKPAKPKTKALTGTVTCELLNVRVAPNKEATIECVLTKGSKVNVNLSESTDGWYKVITAHKITGYCMKKFIAV